MDADLQHPPKLLPLLLDAVGSADIAIASRYAAEHGVRGWNPVRAAISRLSTLAAEPLLRKKNLNITDPMSGFFIVHRRCIDGIAFQPSGFKLLLEVLVRGRIQNAREVPYHFGLRHAGQSKAGAAVAFHYLHLLGRLSRDLVLRSSEQ
jgi:dolichol-phosphate mannosyltransferase